MSQSISGGVLKVNGFSLHRPRLFPLFLFIGVLLVLSLFFVWSRIQVINLEYDISRLEQHLRVARQDGQKLRLEAASLRTPARVERVAREKLGLRLPAPDQITSVQWGGKKS